MKIKDAVSKAFSTPQPAATAQAPAQSSEPASAAPAETSSHDLVLPRPTPELNPRNQILKEIAARSNAQADEDAKETVSVTDEDGNEVSSAPAAAEPVAEAPAVEGEEAQADEAGAAPEVTQPVSETPSGIDPEAEIELIVEGRPMKFKSSQIIDAGKRTLQKETAADYRLNLATQALEEARRQVSQTTQATPTAQAAAQPAAPAAETISDAQLAEMVQFGQPEQAAKAIAEIRRRQPDAVTNDGLQSFMRAQLPRLVQNELAFAEATRFAQTEYADILKDPYLGPLFHLEEDKRRAAGNNKPYADLYREIGDDFRKHFNRPKPAGSAPTAAAPTSTSAAPTIAQRQAAKAAAPAAPKLASARLEGGAQTAKPKTREEVIEAMRKSRGQDSLTRI